MSRNLIRKQLGMEKQHDTSHCSDATDVTPWPQRSHPSWPQPEPSQAAMGTAVTGGGWAAVDVLAAPTLPVLAGESFIWNFIIFFLLSLLFLLNLFQKSPHSQLLKESREESRRKTAPSGHFIRSTPPIWRLCAFCWCYSADLSHSQWLSDLLWPFKGPRPVCLFSSDISKVFISSLDIFLFLGPQWNSQTKQTKPSSFPSGSFSFRAAASHLHHHATVLTTTLTQQSDPAIKDEKMRSVCEWEAGPDVLPGKDKLCVFTQLCLYRFQAWAAASPGLGHRAGGLWCWAAYRAMGFVAATTFVLVRKCCLGNTDAVSSPDPFLNLDS